MKYTVFYSWQSDLPNNTNRGFIEDVLQKSFSLIQKNNFEIEFALDRDTKDIPGSPNIITTIIDKIKKCDIFAADISIINSSENQIRRKSPNPNVLLELGYALAALGTERIILFFNEEYGVEADLPFDIRQNKRINYNLTTHAAKAPLKHELSSVVSSSIKSIVSHGLRRTTKQPIIDVEIIKLDEDKKEIDHLFLLEPIKYFNEDIENIYKELKRVKALDGSEDPVWKDKINKYEEEVEKFVESIKKDSLNYFLFKNKDKPFEYILNVANNGNLKAEDIRINIKVPESILLFKEYPHFRSILPPKTPQVEIPIMKLTRSAFESISKQLFNPLAAHLQPQSTRFPINPIMPKITSGCTIEGDKIIHFWADELLHRHNIKDQDDNFIIIPITTENVKFQVEIFCSQFDDWKKYEIEIPIKKKQ